jgi:hypothetical protein
MGEVAGYKLHPALREVADERDIAGESIEFGNQELRPRLLAGFEGILEYGSVICTLNALYLDERFDELPVPAIQVVDDSLSLCLDAEAVDPCLSVDTFIYPPNLSSVIAPRRCIVSMPLPTS